MLPEHVLHKVVLDEQVAQFVATHAPQPPLPLRKKPVLQVTATPVGEFALQVYTLDNVVQAVHVPLLG